MSDLNIEIQNLLQLAKATALEAGAYLRSRKVESSDVISSIGKDVKLKDDIQSEAIIIRRLTEKSELAILSEEKGWVGNRRNGLRWIIDPLDGSMNFLREIPMTCLSIGLWNDRQPVFGVIYDFNRNELFSGMVGSGAWLNDKSIRVSSTESMQQAILSTGFPSKMNFARENLEGFISEIQAYKKIRMIGSSALSLAYVASGRVDAYYENDIMLWDVAGGIPIVLGAGGSVLFDETNQSEFSLRVFASNGVISQPVNRVK